ncbi:MAG: hypothetical protein IJ864_05200 [Alphaproteobacteria bacterium]|nr:hypothetical protein [Alphaproteobacteria bacterium]
MLIYVDKKKQRRQRIKLFCWVSIVLLILTTNIIHFNTSLNLSHQQLTSYQTIKLDNTWYSQADTIYLFKAQPPQQQHVLIIPSQFNKENAATLALAFSKIPNIPTKLILSSEIIHQKEIYQLAKIFLSTISNQDASQKIYLTTDLETAKKIIIPAQLYPMTLNYKHSEKLKNNPIFLKTLDTIFPPKKKPSSHLAQEKEALQCLVTENKNLLKKIINKQKAPPFALHNLFLQNVRFCLQTNQNTLCETDTHNSFLSNLKHLLGKIHPQQKVQKLILLTTEDTINTSDFIALKKDEGLHFQYQNRESLILPYEQETLNNPIKIEYILKEKAGLNPYYTSPDMTFYKFKTLEVNLDEDI